MYLSVLPFPPLLFFLPQRSKQRLSKELSDYVVYCKSVHFSSFKHSRIHSKFYEVASFTESKARKHLREAGESIVSFLSASVIRLNGLWKIMSICICIIWHLLHGGGGGWFYHQQIFCYNLTIRFKGDYWKFQVIIRSKFPVGNRLNVTVFMTDTQGLWIHPTCQP